MLNHIFRLYDDVSRMVLVLESAFYIFRTFVTMAPLLHDISGHKFGWLTAVEIVGRYNREAVWECKCVCGKHVRVKLGNLRSGNSKSCGCMRFKNNGENND